MASESRDTTGDTGTGADITDIENRRLRTARDSVAAVVEAETEITEEAAVHEGAMVQTPTSPTKTDRKLGAADRTDTKEVGRSRRNNGLGEWGNIREVSHRSPQETVGPAIGAHRILVRPAIAALTARSAIGAHRILARHAMRRSQ